MSRRIMTLLVLLLAAAPAEAQSVTATQVRPEPRDGDAADVDDIVVVTASRREEQLLNAPATMTVLTEEMIANLQIRSVADLLRLVTGLKVVQSSAGGVKVTSRAPPGPPSGFPPLPLPGGAI